jgi:hypothetical protein
MKTLNKQIALLLPDARHNRRNHPVASSKAGGTGNWVKPKIADLPVLLLRLLPGYYLILTFYTKPVRIKPFNNKRRPQHQKFPEWSYACVAYFHF